MLFSFFSCHFHFDTHIHTLYMCSAVTTASSSSSPHYIAIIATWDIASGSSISNSNIFRLVDGTGSKQDRLKKLSPAAISRARVHIIK